MVNNHRNYSENRIKIPFNVTLASTKGIKNKHMRFPNFSRKEKTSQMKDKFKEFVKEIIPAVGVASKAFEKSAVESEMLTITICKDGYVNIMPDHKLGMEVIRLNKNDSYELKTRELLE